MFKYLSIIFLFLCSSLISAAPVPEEFDCKFVKLEKINDTPVSLQTAIVRYTKEDKSVDLISVVHIGEKNYYEKLNNLFTNYDSVCFELVAEKGFVIKQKRDNRDHREEKSVHFMQKLMKDLLNLEHQLDIVNYEKRNFVHADMSFEDLKNKMKERGETPFTVALKTFAEMLENQNLKQNKGFELDLLEILMNKNYFKRILAEQLSNGGENDLGKTLHQILVKDRNEAAMKVLSEELKTKNKTALFYGAAHMPDFHKRLVALGYKPTKVDWLEAWNMKITKEELQYKLLKKLFE